MGVPGEGRDYHFPKEIVGVGQIPARIRKFLIFILAQSTARFWCRLGVGTRCRRYHPGSPSVYKAHVPALGTATVGNKVVTLVNSNVSGSSLPIHALGLKLSKTLLKPVKTLLKPIKTLLKPPRGRPSTLFFRRERVGDHSGALPLLFTIDPYR